jgi:hypothetical protein
MVLVYIIAEFCLLEGASESRFTGSAEMRVQTAAVSKHWAWQFEQMSQRAPATRYAGVKRTKRRPLTTDNQTPTNHRQPTSPLLPIPYIYRLCVKKPPNLNEKSAISLLLLADFWQSVTRCLVHCWRVLDKLSGGRRPLENGRDACF